MTQPAVTIVLATYNRPDTLSKAILSVMLQEYQDWELLVIGDCCDARTQEVVDSFGDNRIHYLNLPVRVGEQAGPNSVGIAAAETPYIAFLNHDDILLQDHLSHGLEMLERERKTFFIGRSAVAKTRTDVGDGSIRPVFSEVRANSQNPGHCLRSPVHMFEPCSAWVLRTDFARSVGSWRSRRALTRSSLHDWLLRAWRKRANFVYGQRTTLLKLTTHNNASIHRGGALYSVDSPEHDCIESWLRTRSASGIRRCVEENFRCTPSPQSEARDSVRECILRTLVSPLARLMYFHFGLDLYAAWKRMRDTTIHDRVAETVLKRTGEVLDNEDVRIEDVVKTAAPLNHKRQKDK